MCVYITKNELKEPRETLLNWIKEVHNYMRKNYGITFQHLEIGSASHNLVVKKCNSKYFDLDYQLTIVTWPDNYDINDAKDVKKKFRLAFDARKPLDFSYCEDSTQALSALNEKKGYGMDVIITVYDAKDNFYILRNNKSANNANNKDYQWAKKNEYSKLKGNLKKIQESKMCNDLRNNYLNKKHKYSKITDKNTLNYKHSFQILNESINEILNEND